MLGPIAAFMSSVTWAIGSQIYSKLTRDFPASTINFTRALVALPLFILGVFISAGGIQGGLGLLQEIGSKQLGWFSLSMICSYGLGDTFFFLSARILGVPGALAIASFYPAWTVIVGSVFGNAQTTLLQWVGLLVALCGIITVILFTPAQKSSARNGTLKGVLFAFSTSVLWGMNTFSVGQGGAGISPFAGNAVRMVLAMLICTILGLVFAKGRPLILPATVIYKNGWIFVLEAFGGSLLFMYGLANSAVVLGATLSALSPVVAVPISLLTKAEQFSLPRSLGVLLSAIGVCLILSSNPLQ